MVTSWRERESRTEMELPEGKAKRPEGLRSAEPRLFRLGGPGSMKSQESCEEDNDDKDGGCDVFGEVGKTGLGLDIVLELLEDV